MLKAKDIMTKDVQTVSGDTDVEELARLFAERNINAMPVLDRAGGLLGVVTQTDLIEQDRPLHIPKVVSLFDWVIYLESQKNFREEVERITARKVTDICNREVATCTPETPVSQIADLMVEQRLNLIPVMDGDDLVGVVARLDIIRSMRH